MNRITPAHTRTIVIPAQAGIQPHRATGNYLDPGLRRDDGHNMHSLIFVRKMTRTMLTEAI